MYDTIYSGLPQHRCQTPSWLSHKCHWRARRAVRPIHDLRRASWCPDGLATDIVTLALTLCVWKTNSVCVKLLIYIVFVFVIVIVVKVNIMQYDLATFSTRYVELFYTFSFCSSFVVYHKHMLYTKCIVHSPLTIPYSTFYIIHDTCYI